MCVWGSCSRGVEYLWTLELELERAEVLLHKWSAAVLLPATPSSTVSERSNRRSRRRAARTAIQGRSSESWERGLSLVSLSMFCRH